MCAKGTLGWAPRCEDRGGVTPRSSEAFCQKRQHSGFFHVSGLAAGVTRFCHQKRNHWFHLPGIRSYARGPVFLAAQEHSWMQELKVSSFVTWRPEFMNEAETSRVGCLPGAVSSRVRLALIQLGVRLPKLPFLVHSEGWWTLMSLI